MSAPCFSPFKVTSLGHSCPLWLYSWADSFSCLLGFWWRHLTFCGPHWGADLLCCESLMLSYFPSLFGRIIGTQCYSPIIFCQWPPLARRLQRDSSLIPHPDFHTQTSILLWILLILSFKFYVYLCFFIYSSLFFFGCFFDRLASRRPLLRSWVINFLSIFTRNSVCCAFLYGKMQF